ncbi:hypothetical protein [Streptomyces hyaluromycini]|uniref:hypothetical protein n=1 Tax=Streptomyces hyaluromycini TaxID=1377993 RepID=UPI000B5C3CBC|nr:hypothetical protein [Streptomyces hyaluromycini]
MTAEFGLSWLSMQCDGLEQTLTVAELDCLVESGPRPALLMIAARSVTDVPAPSRTLLGRDVRRLLESPLDDAVLRTVWAEGTDTAFDPGWDEESMRDWLAGIEAAWRDAERLADPGFVPPPQVSAPDPGLRAAVLETIDGVAARLAAVTENRVWPPKIPGLLPALTEVVESVDADLGFRLFLRVLKASALPVGPRDHQAFLAVGERFGYPDLVAEGYLHVVPAVP